MNLKRLLILVVITLIATVALVAAQAQAEFDLVISGGKVVDGTGNPWFTSDVAIKNGQIAAIGRIAPQRGLKQIDARGLVVVPGFVDVLSHIEGGINRLPEAENFLRMGVTSLVTGNCGNSALQVGEWMAGLESAGVSVNIATLVGHNTVRRAGMNGDFDRVPTPEELDRMREFVANAMRAGAVGLSTGLEYIPGTYARTDEIVQLAKVAAASGGVYATHMRNEGLEVEKSIRESLEIGSLSGCPVEISHFKVSSRKRWGASVETIRLVAEARARGQQITVDQYLYPAGSTGIGILFPSWLFEADKSRERLADEATRARVRKELLAKARSEGFNDLSFAFVASHRANTAFNGKNIKEITQAVKGNDTPEDQAEQAIEILLAGGAQMVLHKMSEADVERIIRQPFTMVASDAGPLEVGGDGIPHPRGFGNNARVLSVYVREKKLLGLEEAIRKMTSLPAQTFALWDRGILRPGMAADIVIFDEGSVKDRATFEQPKQYPVGIEYVLVNGVLAIEKQSHTKARSGKILRGSGAKS